MADFEYIKKYYGVPADYGREIMFQGNRKGIIVKDMGHYIGVTFDDRKPGTIDSLHPTWEVEYLEIGKVRKMTKSQQKYQDYLSSEYPDSFADYLGIKEKTK